MNPSVSTIRRTLTAIHNNTSIAVPDEPDRLHPVEILLVLDARARIQYHSEDLPLRHSKKEIVDLPINSLIPDLPLRERTPGYNIAYVRCSFSTNTWQRHHIAADDFILPIDLHLRTLPVAGGYCLLGLMRFVAIETQESRTDMSCPSTHAWLSPQEAPLVTYT